MLNLILYILIILILVLLFYLFKTCFKQYNYFAFVVTFLCSLIIISIVLNPKLCITATIYGVKLFVYNVFPSLFVFIAIFNIIFSSGGVKIYSSIFGKILCKPFNLPTQCSIVLIISLMCGYPLGAKYAVHLYEIGNIDKATTEKLITIASNSSPLFVIGSVGTIMFGNKNIGYILLLITNISVIIVGFLTRGRHSMKNNKIKIIESNHYSSKNFGEILKKSLENALLSSMNIGAFIIFFSLIISLMNNYVFIFIHNKIIKATLNGLIEVTLGCKELSLLTCNINTKFLIALFVISFSGLSIISQIYSIIYKYKISIKKYILYKLLHGTVSVTLGLFFIKLQPLDALVFNNSQSTSTKTMHIFLILLFFILAAPIIKLFRNFNVS